MNGSATYQRLPTIEQFQARKWLFTRLPIDAVHPTLSTKISLGWIRNGQNKVLETTGYRSQLNIVGALNLSDIGATVVNDNDSINSESIASFFCQLRESYPLAHKLHIILDEAGYHRSNLVRDAAFVLNYRASLPSALQP